MIRYTIEIKSINNQVREYDFYSEELGALGEIKDEIRIKQGQIYVLKRIGFTKEFLSYVLPEEELIKAEQTDKIKLFKGTNDVRVKDINGNYILEYFIDNPELELLATQGDLEESRSEISLLEGEASLRVNKESVITEINQSPETVSIKADKIKLEGHTTINEGFSVDLDGNMQCRDANINNLVNKSGIYTNMTFYNITKESFVGPRSWGGLSYIGYDGNNKRIPVFINYSIPEKFTVVRAYLIVKHQSVTWQSSANPNSRAIDIEVYHKQLTFTGSIGYDFQNYYDKILLSNFIGTRINNIWGNGIHSYTFPIGYRTKTTTDISNLINTNKQGVISFAPKLTSVTFDPNNPISPERDLSSFLGATLYIYGYLDKE